MKTKYTVLLLSVALMLSFTACDDGKNIGTSNETGVIINKLDESPTAEVTAAFFEAQTAALYFSGYGRHMYTEGSIEVEGGVYPMGTTQYDRFAMCDTMEELHEAVETVFTDELAETFLNSTVSGMPMFLEQDGILYRFGGYVAQYQAEPKLTEILSCRENDDGSITLSVRETFGDAEEDIVVEHDYTCVKDDGSYKFTNEFPLLVELAAERFHC